MKTHELNEDDLRALQVKGRAAMATWRTRRDTRARAIRAKCRGAADGDPITVGHTPDPAMGAVGAQADIAIVRSGRKFGVIFWSPNRCQWMTALAGACEFTRSGSLAHTADSTLRDCAAWVANETVDFTTAEERVIEVGDDAAGELARRAHARDTAWAQDFVARIPLRFRALTNVFVDSDGLVCHWPGSGGYGIPAAAFRAQFASIDPRAIARRVYYEDCMGVRARWAFLGRPRPSNPVTPAVWAASECARPTRIEEARELREMTLRRLMPGVHWWTTGVALANETLGPGWQDRRVTAAVRRAFAAAVAAAAINA